MDYTAVSKSEEANKKRGMTLSIVLHIVALLLLFLPMIHYQNPPPGQEGILVNLGIPDVGEGDENAADSAPEVTETPDEPSSEPVEEVEPDEPEEDPVPEVKEPQKKPEPPKQTKPEPAKPDKQAITNDAEKALAAQKKKIEDAKRAKDAAERAEKQREEAEAEKKRQAEAAAKAKKKAERDAKIAAAKARADKLKGNLSGTGPGKGNTGTAGNQGVEDGDPNADAVVGISTGPGKVGGGLGGRGLVNAPPLNESSQNFGYVTVSLCVRADGTVEAGSVRVKQTQSSIFDSKVIKQAISNAKKWKFSANDKSKQCGTIRYDFKAK